MSYNTVKYWIKKYNKFSIEKLLKPRSGSKNNTYDPAFKIRVTEYWLEHPEISAQKIAELFHASRSAVRSWRKKYLEQGKSALENDLRRRYKEWRSQGFGDMTPTSIFADLPATINPRK